MPEMISFRWRVIRSEVARNLLKAVFGHGGYVRVSRKRLKSGLQSPVNAGE